jgi:hypothetical protein
MSFGQALTALSCCAMISRAWNEPEKTCDLDNLNP